jgi:hypothetical protein
MKPAQGCRIKVAADGPYVVEGGVKLAHQHVVTHAQGESLEWREGEGVRTSARAIERA